MNDSPSESPTGRRPGPLQHLGRLFRLTLKEEREILRDRRTLITLVLMPLLLYPLLSLGFQAFFRNSLGAPTEPAHYIIGFESEADFQIIASYLTAGGLRLQAEPMPVPSESVSSQTAHADQPVFLARKSTDFRTSIAQDDIDVGLRLLGDRVTNLSPDHDLALNCEMIFNGDSQIGSNAAKFIEQYRAAANREFLEARLARLDVTQRPEPMRLRRKELSDPSVSGHISVAAVIPFILILMTITGAVYPAIDLTAGERERGTLEILVAAPIPRFSLLFAKYLAVLTVALLTATLNLITMTVTVLVSGLGEMLFGPPGLTLGTVAAVFGLLLLFASFFSAGMLVLTSFARSFKEAQAYLIPLMLGSLAPGMLSLTPGLELAGLWLVTPLVNIVLLGRDLFEARATAGSAVVVVIATAFYAAAAIAVASRIFGAESVLYSTHRNYSDLLRRPREVQPAGTISGALLCLALLFPAFFLMTGLLARTTAQLLENPSVESSSFIQFLQHLQHQFGLSTISLQLMGGAAITALLFGGFPAVAAYFGRIDLRRGFRFQNTSWLAFPAALLLGVSLWPFAYEIVVFKQMFGLVTLSEAHLQRVQDMLQQLRLVSPITILVALALFPAVFEEVFFRGYLMTALRAGTSDRTAIWGSAVLFGLFHLVATDALAFERFVPSTMLGLVLGWVCWRTGSLWPGILLHASHNGLALMMTYYKEQLQNAGWANMSDQQHLPLTWLAAAAVVSLAGAALLRFACPRPPAGEIPAGDAV